LLGVKVLVVCDVHELLPASAKAQLVAFSHPFRLLITDDVQESLLGEVRFKLRLKEK
jgi:hypothetical protein